MRTYGTTRLTVTSPPQSFTEPLTLDAVKQFLELPERSPVDSEEDNLLNQFITGARCVAETCLKRDLVRKQYDLLLDYFPAEIEVYGPLQSVDLVRYRDSDGNYTDVAETGYVVDLARGLIMPSYSSYWPSFTPWPSSAVLIRYTSGFDLEPWVPGPGLAKGPPLWAQGYDGGMVLIGMKMLISHWFTGRLPFEPNASINELPWTVTNLFRALMDPILI